MNKRNSLLLVLLSIAVTIFAPPAVDAAVFLRPALMYLENSEEFNGTTSTNRRTLIDFALGWSSQGGYTLGGLYGVEQKTRVSETASSKTETEASRSSLGASLGWISPSDVGPYIYGTYFFDSSFEEGNTDYKGAGYQIDLGVRFPFRRVSLALQLSYKAFEYKKYTFGSTTYNLTSPLRHRYVDPYFAVFVEF